MAVPMHQTLSPLKPRNLNLNSIRIRKGPVGKCLFGKADPIDTYKLVQEQFENDRQRFYERFGINIENLENVAESPKRTKSSEKLKIAQEKNSRQCRVLKPYNLQAKMTDFCQIKKTASNQQAKKL